MKDKKTSSTHIEIENPSGGKPKDDLLVSLMEIINKSNKDKGRTAFFLDEEENPALISDWVSTGCTMLDLAISNRPDGGLPAGKLVELQGAEASGKSLLAAHTLAETQKKGGVAVFIDVERAVSVQFLRAIGVNISDLVYENLTMIEDIFDRIEQIIAHVRKANKDRLVTIVVDSIAAASTRDEMESDHGKTGFATTKAIVISKAMRKITDMIASQRVLLIFTNQLRMNLAAGGYGPPTFTTSGGKAIGYHSSVRIRLKSTGAIKVMREKRMWCIGMKCRATLIKNRLGPPMKYADIEIYFDRGIDNYGSWLKSLRDYGVISGAKSPYKYTTNTGEEVVLDAKTFGKVMKENIPLKDEIYKKICDLVIMKYQDSEAEIVEDAEIDETIDGGEEATEKDTSDEVAE